MADHKELIQWILKNKDFFDIVVTDYNWIRPVFNSYWDLGVQMQITGVFYDGRGSCVDENIALAKAVCESIERNVCRRSGISSLGVAGHLNYEMASYNSRTEFIERYALWQQFHGVSHFFLKEKTLFSFNNQTAQIEIYEAKTNSHETVTLVIANGLNENRPYGIIFGLGCHSQEEQSKRKAEIECYRNLTAFFDNQLTPINETEFKKIKSPTSIEQIRLCLDPAYAGKIIRQLNFSDHVQTLPLPPLITSQIDYDTSSLMDCPLVFVKTTLKESPKDFTLEFLG